MTRRAASRDARLLTATERGELAFDVGPDPRTIGVTLRLAGPAPSEELLAAILEDRLPGAPRWACRVLRPSDGPPQWDPVAVDVAAHVRTVELGSGAEDDVLAATERIMREPWDLAAAPPWRVTRLVTPTGPDAVVLTLHHVLTDGTGALATASALLGMTDPPEPSAAPAPAGPVRGVIQAARTVVLGAAEVAAGFGRAAPRTALAVPISPGFRLTIVDLDLAQVRAVARRSGATVNDVLLVAGTGAMGRLLARRGRPADRLVCSVPVSRARPGDTDRRVRTGVLRVPVPVDPALSSVERLRRTAARSRRRRRFATGESAPLLGGVFELFGRLGIYRHVLERQRVINTVVSNLRGPAEPLALAGVPVAGVVPVAPGVGNVPLYFTALSYAGRLVVTLRADHQVAAELPALAADLRAVVDELADG
ncbi:WS/DGAT domain-containing protein [Xylanimonas sp. McL0601]|uniref:WS/DGAT domain-containing protein n=1 Tax=Xylanimonas sp. McL0601 TaxID=3414739 RepID=UPI003CF2FA5B